MTLSKSNHQHFLFLSFKSCLDIILNPFTSLFEQFFVCVLDLQQFILSFFLQLKFFVWDFRFEKLQAKKLYLLFDVTRFLKQLIVCSLEPFFL